jgi:hypothetical protein
MKRKSDSQIASLFRNREAKIASSSLPLVVLVADEQTEDPRHSAPPVQSDSESENETKDAIPDPPSSERPSATSYDAHFMP